MSWNPQPALGGALWSGNQTIATVRQLLSTSAGLANTGDSNFDSANISTLYVSTITGFYNGTQAINIQNAASISISTSQNLIMNGNVFQLKAKGTGQILTNGTFQINNQDPVTGSRVGKNTDILTGQGSFQALAGNFTLGASDVLNAFGGNKIAWTTTASQNGLNTGIVDVSNNNFFNVRSLSSLSISTGTARVGALTANGITMRGDLDMNGNSIGAANVITTNSLGASVLSATTGFITSVIGDLQGNVTGNLSNTNLTVKGKYSINETVDVGSAVGDYGSYGTLNLNAKGGLGGIVNITADVATPNNPAVTVSQLTAEAKGNYGLITPGTPIGYIPRGGLVSIIARQGLTPSPPAEVTSALFANGEIDLTAYSYGTVPGLIKMSAGANSMYAGTVSPITGIYGNNYIYGQYANSITAGLPAGGLPNTPGTNYIYGYNGTIVENGLYVDTVYNKFGGDLSLNARTSNLNLNGATVQAQTNVVGQGHGLFDFANITGVNYDISINASGGHAVNLSNVNNFYGSNIGVNSISTVNIQASNAYIKFMGIENLSTNNILVSSVTTGDITGLPGTATATTVSFVYTGGNQTWTAPAGCYYIDITLNGACGGNFSGFGGKVSGRLNVNPGQVYTIIVGGGGQNTTPGPATYGGGGAGNYSGGGRTAIAYAGADLATAGGGGGNPYYSGFTGGNGGGLTGAAGTGTGADGGLGGSQIAGGSGGVDSNPGGNGSQYQGGTGSGYGGGGGGGYFGGGGGADSGNPPAFLSGGGGGGSSYVANLYYNVVNTQGGGATTGRNGTASITYYIGNDTVVTLDAQQTNITGNAFIDGDVTGVNTLTATAVTTNTIQSLNPITISSPSLVLSCTPSTTGAFTVNGRGMRNFEFGISQTWSANQLNGVKTVTDANGARYHPSQWVMNHALLGVYEFAGINTASALNYIQTYATTDTNGYLALQWQIFANVDRSGNNGVIKWNLTMIPLEMTQALAPTQVSAGAVVPVALSTVLYTYPNTFASTIIASTLSIKASENLALIANLPYPTFLGVGTVAINANTNVDLMANVDITLGAAHDINATATSNIRLTAPAIKLDVNDVNIHSYGSQAFRFVKESPYNYLQTVGRPMIITGLGGADSAFSFDGTGSNKSFRNLDMCNHDINNIGNEYFEYGGRFTSFVGGYGGQQGILDIAYPAAGTGHTNDGILRLFGGQANGDRVITLDSTNIGINVPIGYGNLYLNANTQVNGFLDMNNHPIYMGNATIYNANELYNNNTDLLLTGIGRNIILQTFSGGNIQLNGTVYTNNNVFMNGGFLQMNCNAIRICSDQYHALAFGNSGTYNVGVNGPFLVGYNNGALGTSGTSFNNKSLEWSYTDVYVYKRLDMCNNNITNVGSFYRVVSGTAIAQPVLQYGTATGSGVSGSVNVTLPVAYTSASSYVVFASMMDTVECKISVNRNSASNITIYWSQAGSGTQTLGWQTSGN